MDWSKLSTKQKILFIILAIIVVTGVVLAIVYIPNHTDNDTVIYTSDTCRLFASEGKCTTDDNVMKNCATSCSKISQSIPIDDTDKSCQAWASAGECSKNPGYMLLNCATSCANY